MAKQIVVLDMQSGIPNSVKCFSENKVEDAENHFRNLVKKDYPNIEDEQLNDSLDGGNYTSFNGKYEVYLIWE